MNIFNRKEVLTTFSLVEKKKLLQYLQAHNIKYHIKTMNRNSPSAFSDTRARTGTFGQRPDLMYEYKIYVHKKNYDSFKNNNVTIKEKQ